MGTVASKILYREDRIVYQTEKIANGARQRGYGETDDKKKRKKYALARLFLLILWQIARESRASDCRTR